VSHGDILILCADRYVIIGCHFDAWTFGGVSPNTGTAVMMELVKAMTHLRSTGEVNILLIKNDIFFLCLALSKLKSCPLLFIWNSVRGMISVI